MALLPMILGKIVVGAVGDVLAKNSVPIAKEVIPAISDAVVDAIGKDPAVQNEMNAERPIQSRTGVGGSMAFIASLGIVLQQVGSNKFPNYDFEVLLPALAGVWGGAFTVYGRFKSGLKPLSWFGLVKG